MRVWRTRTLPTVRQTVVWPLGIQSPSKRSCDLSDVERALLLDLAFVGDRLSSLYD